MKDFLLGTFGVKLPPDTTSRKTHECKICQERFVWNQKRNIDSHLQSKHSGLYNQAKDFFEKTKGEQESAKSEGGKVAYGKKRQAVSARFKRVADVHLTIAIVLENLKLELGERKHFRNFIESIHGVALGRKEYIPASGKTVVKYLACWEAVAKHAARNKFSAIVESSVPGCRQVSPQYNLWENSRKESVIGATITYYNDAEGFKQSCLGLQVVEGAHTGENVSKAVAEIVEECAFARPNAEMDDATFLQQVCDTTTTDAGSDAKKSASLLGLDWHHCSLHALNLVIKKAMAESSAKLAVKTNPGDFKELFDLLETSDWSEGEGSDEGVSEMLDFIGEAVRVINGELDRRQPVYHRAEVSDDEVNADIDKLFQQTIVKFTLATVGKQIEAELKDEVERAKKALDSKFDSTLVN